MYRKQSSHLLDGRLTRVLAQSVIHADASGIYVNTIHGRLMRYTHEFKRVAEYSLQQHMPIKGICAHSHISDIGDRLICYSHALIYAVPTLKTNSPLIHIHTTRPDIIVNVLYHPIRNTYLVATSDGKTIEFDTNFRRIREFAPCCQWLGRRMQPSRHSPMIYSIVPSVESAQLYMHNPPSDICLLADVARYSRLLMRPEHLETLVITSVHSVSLLDAAHTSASGLSKYSFSGPISRSIASEHINSNVCAICTDNNMVVIDYRFGLAQTIRTKIVGLDGMWIVGDRIYIANEPAGSFKCLLHAIEM